ncbi:MAG: Mrp/NBP35 family ATP-binding protein [Bacillota bacterium]
MAANEHENTGGCALAADGRCPGGATCGQPEAASCGAAQKAPQTLPQNELSNVRRVVAIMSGKGGVGKSSVTGMLAVTLKRAGYKVGILDADLTGPSIPKIFGLRERPDLAPGGEHIAPVESRRLGIGVMSINLMLDEPDEPVIWRGPIIGSAIKQFWSDVAWGDLDYLLVDLPPGTGDAPLTVMQSLPVDGLIVVSLPQDLAVLIVKKAIRMARLMQIPILGLIENMSYAVCPECGTRMELFGPSRAEEVARETGVRLLARLPIDPQLSDLCDRGEIEAYEAKPLAEVPAYLEEALAGRRRAAGA